MNGEFFVLHVENEEEMPENKRRSLEANIQFAENVGARVVRLKGSSVPAVTGEYISRNRITQVIFGRSAVKGWEEVCLLSCAAAVHERSTARGCTPCDPADE